MCKPDSHCFIKCFDIAKAGRKPLYYHKQDNHAEEGNDRSGPESLLRKGAFRKPEWYKTVRRSKASHPYHKGGHPSYAIRSGKKRGEKCRSVETGNNSYAYKKGRKKHG
jgi:hypothetical protein